MQLKYHSHTRDLKRSMTWYVDNYGIPLSTLRRNRGLLDNPKLLYEVMAGRVPGVRLAKLRDFLRSGGAK